MRLPGLTNIAPGLYSYKSPISAQGITYTLKREKRNTWRIHRNGTDTSQSFNVYHCLSTCIYCLSNCQVRWVNPASRPLEQLAQAGYSQEIA